MRMSLAYLWGALQDVISSQGDLMLADVIGILVGRTAGCDQQPG